MTVKDAERGTSGAPRSGPCSLTAVRAEATTVKITSKGRPFIMRSGDQSAGAAAFTDTALTLDLRSSGRSSHFISIQSYSPSPWLEIGEEGGAIRHGLSAK